MGCASSSPPDCSALNRSHALEQAPFARRPRARDREVFEDYLEARWSLAMQSGKTGSTPGKAAEQLMRRSPTALSPLGNFDMPQGPSRIGAPRRRSSEWVVSGCYHEVVGE